MDSRLHNSTAALRIAFGLMATLAGLDKFLNVLADWGRYVSPLAAQVIPVPTGALMAVVGVVEIAVGICILAVAPLLGAYVASAWLLLVAINLVLGGFFDIAVRDVVLAISAYVLAQLIAVGTHQHVLDAHADPRGRRVSA
jgi:uncharacterized membrane protein YphA (DoxX/SURF4 family)